MLLQEQVQHYEQITATHLPQLQLGDAATPVGPAYRDHLVAKPAHDRLQRKLDGQVEVFRDERAAAFYGLPPVALEGVGYVVVAGGE